MPNGRVLYLAHHNPSKCRTACSVLMSRKLQSSLPAPTEGFTPLTDRDIDHARNNLKKIADRCPRIAVVFTRTLNNFLRELEATDETTIERRQDRAGREM